MLLPACRHRRRRPAPIFHPAAAVAPLHGARAAKTLPFCDASSPGLKKGSLCPPPASNGLVPMWPHTPLTTRQPQLAHGVDVLNSSPRPSPGDRQQACHGLGPSRRCAPRHVAGSPRRRGRMSPGLGGLASPAAGRLPAAPSTSDSPRAGLVSRGNTARHRPATTRRSGTARSGGTGRAFTTTR